MAVLLVTGGARRLGREIALGAARKGWDVAVHFHHSRKEALRTVSEIRALGRRAVAIRGDLSRVPDCRRVVREAGRRMGRLDALVNSAADFFPTPLPRVEEQDWDRLIDLNLKGSFFCAQEAARLMRRGAVVQILDASRDWTRYAAYGISKAGAEAMVGILARALAPRIRVNAVAPGPVALTGDRKVRNGVAPARVVRAVLGLLSGRRRGAIITVT